MLIQEEILRQIIREELIKEGFLSDFANNKGLVIATGLLALVANVGKALANPASQESVQYFKDTNTKIETMAKKLEKDPNLPPHLKIKFKDSCDTLTQKMNNFEKANVKHKKIQGPYEKNLDSDNPNNKINKLYDKVEKEAKNALNDLIESQQKCKNDIKEAKDEIEAALADELIQKTLENFN